MMNHRINRTVWIAVTVLAMTGCSKSPDEQIVDMAREHTALQAEQNRRFAEMQQDISRGSRELVEADATARTELVSLQRDLQQDHRELGRQRDQLEQQRQAIDGQRDRDQLTAAAVSAIGLILAVALPLVLAGYILHTVRSSRASDAELTEVLIDELAHDHPRLSGSRPALPLQSAAPMAERSDEQ